MNHESGPKLDSQRKTSRRRTGTETAKRGELGTAHSTFAQVAGIAALVLAALQLIPAYSVPQSLWLLVIGGVVALGLFVFLFLQIRSPENSERRRFFMVMVLMFALAIASGYHIFSLRADNTNLKRQLVHERGSEPLQQYLDMVVKEGEDKWDGEFESRYVRPTLYLLNDEGTRNHSPLRIQEQILLWRTGNAGMSREFKGVVGLVGEISSGDVPSIRMFPDQDKPHDLKVVATAMVNYVDRPLADSDLLNKRQGEKNPRRAKDDIPVRVLVLGDPAVGKSAMMERLDLIQARRARGSSSEPIPIRINLSNLESTTLAGIEARIRERVGEAYTSATEERKFILLADALDESADPLAVSKAIVEFTKAHEANLTRVIVAARLRNYAQIIHESDSSLWRHGFSTVILYGLDQTAVEKQILTRSTTEVRQRLFMKLADSRTRSAWLQFLRLPMNYDLVAELMAESSFDVLPQGQSQLVEKFIARRFVQKNIDAADAEHCKALLSTVGMNLIADGIEKRGREFMVEDFLRPDENQSQSSVLKRRMDQLLASGLIVERRPGRYKFCHLNILDYFVAKGLERYDMVDPSRPEWWAIILFRCGMPNGAGMVPYLEQAVAAGAKFDRDLLEEARIIVEARAETTSP